MAVCANIRNPFDRFVTHYQRLIGGWLESSQGVQRRAVTRKYDLGELSKAEFENRMDGLALKMRKQKRRRAIMRIAGFNCWILVTLLRWRWRDRGLRNGDGGRFLSQLFPMLDGVNVVVCQENLQGGFGEVLKRQGFSREVCLEEKNITPGKISYKKYYWKLTRSIIEKWYHTELRYMAYDFHGAYR